MKNSTSNAFRFAVAAGMASFAAIPEAEAAPIEPPRLVEGKHVYTVPEGFLPPGVEQADIRTIENTIQTFRYKYYVVLVEQVNGPENPAQMDKILDNGVESLTDVWKRKSPRQFDNASLLFVQVTRPRKYRFWSGVELERKGLYKSTHVQFNDLFVRQAKEGNSTQGILDMGIAVNNYLTDRVNPQPAAPALPTSKTPPRKSSPLPPSPPDPEHDRKVVEALKYLAGVLVAMVGAFLLYMRKRNNSKIQAGFRAEIEDFENTMYQLEQQLEALYQKRQFIERFEEHLGSKTLDSEGEGTHYRTAHKELSGDTKDLYERTVRRIDYLYLGLAAMRRHLELCGERARKAHFFKREPLEEANRMLPDGAKYRFSDLEFEESKLFIPLSEDQKKSGFFILSPNEFCRNAKAGSKETMAFVDELIQAQGIQAIDVRKAFVPDTYRTLLEALRTYSVSEHWLEGHPLYGPDREAEFYAELETLRRTDPVKYRRDVQKAGKDQAIVEDTITHLLGFLEKVQSVEQLSLKLPKETIVEDHDNPEKILKLVQSAAGEFRQLLATSKKIEDLAAKANDVLKLADQARNKLEAITDALYTVQVFLEKLKILESRFSDAKTKAVDSLKIASRNHPRVSLPTVENAQRAFTSGQAALQAAVALVESKKHLDAKRKAQSAHDFFHRALQVCENILTECAKLDKLKSQYAQILTQLPGQYAKIKEEINKLQVELKPESYEQLPDLGEVVDYAAAIQQAQKLMESWEKNLKDAKEIYDERLKKAAAEEEALQRSQSSNDDAPSHQGGNLSGGDY